MSTNFVSAVGVTTVGAGEIDKLAAALDKSAAALENLGKKGESLKTPKWENFAGGVKDFVSNPLDTAGKGVESFLLRLGPMGAAASTAAAGLGILAKTGYEWEKQLGELGDRIGDISIRTGLSIKETGEFSFAMKRAGGDISQVEGIMRKLSQGLADNSDEGSKVREGLKELGIVTHDFQGTATPMSNVLLQLSEGLGKVEGTANRNAIAMKIMGRSALDALPDLLELSAGVKRSRELGLAPSEEDVKRWDAYHKQIAETDAQWEKLVRRLKEPLVAKISFVLDLPNVPWVKKFFAGQSMSTTPGGPPLDYANDPLAGLREGIAAQSATNAAGVKTNDAAVAAALLGTTENQLARAQAKLKDLQGGLKTGVLPAVNADTLKQIAAQEKIVTGLETQIKSTKELSDVHRKWADDFIANEKKMIDAINTGAKAYTDRQDAVTGKLFSGAATNAQAGRAAQDWSFGKFEQQNQAFMIRGLTAWRGRETGTQSQDRQAAELTQLSNTIQQANVITAQLMNSQVDASARILELRAGPGGEFAAAEKIADLRRAALMEEFSLTGDIEKLRAQSQQIELDRTVRIEELRKQGRDRIRGAAESGFDALISGGAGGLKSLLLSQATGMGRTVAGNLAVEQSGFLSKILPNAKEGSLAGRLLAGTPFGPDPQKTATDANTRALIDNTAALYSMSGGTTSAARNLLFSSAPGAAGMLGGPAADLYNLPTTASRSRDLMLSPAPGASMLQPGFNWGKGVGVAGAAVAGGLGIMQGVKAGGAEGALTTAGSAAALIGTLLPVISKSLSFLGPIGMAAGIGLGLAATFLPNPKEQRAKEIDREIAAARYTAPDAAMYTMDRRGRGFDYDTQGNTRPIINITMNMDNLDAQSIIDRGGDIAEAVANAMEGHLSPRYEAATRSIAFRN